MYIFLWKNPNTHQTIMLSYQTQAQAWDAMLDMKVRELPDQIIFNDGEDVTMVPIDRFILLNPRRPHAKKALPTEVPTGPSQEGDQQPQA